MAAPEIRQALLDELAAATPERHLHLMRHWPGGRLSLVHFNVLFLLSGGGPLPMNRLADLLDVSQASATGIVDRMEQRGLVTRERDAGDRRVIRVVPTPQGETLIATVAAERRDKLACLLDTLADEDAAALLQGMQAMRRAREAMFAKAPSMPTDSSEAPR